MVLGGAGSEKLKSLLLLVDSFSFGNAASGTGFSKTTRGFPSLTRVPSQQFPLLGLSHATDLLLALRIRLGREDIIYAGAFR